MSLTTVSPTTVSPTTIPTQPALSAVLADTATAERLEFPDGSTIALLAEGPSNGGALDVHHTLLRDGADGASPHHHEVVTEVFYVLRGSAQLLVGDELVTARAGHLAVIPPGVPHAFGAAPGDDAELLVWVMPGIARFDLFRRFERVLAGRERPRSVAIDQSAYDTYPDISPTWDQARSITQATATTTTRESR